MRRRGVCWPETLRRWSVAEVRRTDAVRLVAALGAVEMALVRQDPIAAPLLTQAARAAAGTGLAGWLEAAATITRDPAFTEDDPGARARRKVVQALCRASAQGAQAAILDAGARA